MDNLKKRLDKLEALIQDPDFLEGKGLSNEVNIRIFCYDPKDEMAVRYFIEKLMNKQNLKCHLIEYNLYKVFLSICDDLDVTEALLDLEKSVGGSYLWEQIHIAIGEEDFTDKMQYSPHEKGDVIMLTGIGDVFPFMRVHTLLEALQPYFSDIPILVLYPGNFDGHCLKLFGRLTPNDYYRAFNIF